MKKNQELKERYEKAEKLFAQQKSDFESELSKGIQRPYFYSLTKQSQVHFASSIAYNEATLVEREIDSQIKSS